MSRHRGAADTGPENRSPRAWLGWAMFDWANQPYFTLITTFIFAPYFATVVIGDAVRGQTLWSFGQSAAGLVTALLAPLAGATIDALGPRKPWIAICTVVAMMAMAALWFAEPGMPQSALWVLSLVVMASIAVEMATVFNNAMLPSLAGASTIGRLSGLGWGLGYAGGLLALLTVVLVFEQPWFGLDAASGEPARLSGPFSALWLGVFVIPLFVFTPDSRHLGLRLGTSFRRGLENLLSTLRSAARQRNIATYLVGRMLYQDGLTAIYAFGGIYAAGVFGWQSRTLGIFGIVLIVFSMAGAFAGGWLDDRIGSRRTVMIGLCGLIIGSLGIVSVSAGEVLFIFEVDRAAVGAPLFSGTAERFMVAFSAIVGVCGGPVQAASRTLLARLAPEDKTAAFFGLYALSGKATAFMAPLLIGVITATFASQRAGLAVVVVFLAAGLALLAVVREERP